MTRKLIALALSLVMVLSLAIPGTLAIGMASDSSDYTMKVEADVPAESDTTVPVEESAAPAPTESKEPAAMETPAASEKPAATETPVASEEPTATETPVASEEPAATETPAASEEPAIMTQGQVAANYNTLMAAATIEEMENILAQMSEDELNFFVAALTEDQVQQVNTKATALIPPASTPVLEEPDQPDNRPILYPAKNFTNAAPFLLPVTGSDCNTEDDRFLLEPDQPADAKGLETSKTVSDPDKNGQYTLTLEAWATGQKAITQQTTQVPTDIILVLDQSGSMGDPFNSRVYEPFTATPATLFEKQKDLYVQLKNDSFAPVTVTEVNVTYVPYSDQSNSTYRKQSGNFYHKCNGRTYGAVTVDYSRFFGYVYRCSKCNWTESSTKSNTVPTFANQFYQKGTVDSYTFSYTDATGTTVTETVKSSDSAPQWDFYIAKPGPKMSRIAALQKAVSNFASAVAEKAKGPDGQPSTADDVNHRIAVVGFASDYNSPWSNDNYENSEIFIGAKQHRYDDINPNICQKAFQDMDDPTGINNVTASIDALRASGATYINLGVDMGNQIFKNNPVNEKRNRVMIVFTDGQPGESGYDSKIANAAITEAETTKTTYGATVYSVGIFEGADAMSSGKPDGDSTQKSNWFMQNLSSNNGDVRNPSYYLSAGDSDALNKIFETISSNIENGSSSITLNTETVMKDVISDYFQLPKGARPQDIKVYTAMYTGENNFASKEPFNNATISISEDGKTVSVTNFDYSDNWVGTETNSGQTTYRGQKLIVEIPIVVRDGFLGGNGVPTNGRDSGIYTNKTETQALENFKVPKTDVPIPDITVTAMDKNIYLTQVPTQKQLLEDATIRCGNFLIDFANPNGNYGLEPWQNEFVSVDQPSAIPQCDGKDDSTYTVGFTVSPKTTGSVTQKAYSATGEIHVFKPVIEYKDSTMNLGETADYETENMPKDNVVWKHNDKSDKTVTMIGTAPQLDFTYTPQEGAFTQDTDVCVTVSIGAEDVTNHVAFINRSSTHQNATNHQFTVYVKSCTLTIRKTANAPGVFKFHVVNAEKTVDMNVVIEVKSPNQTESVTLKGLPQGTYTVTEDTNWSWNFTPDKNNKTVKLAGETWTGSVAFVNTLHNKWLNDSVCVKNTPGMSSTAK